MDIRTGSWTLPQSATIQERCDILGAHLVDLTGREKIDYAFVEIPISDIFSKNIVIDGPMGPEPKRKLFGTVKSITQLWAYHGGLCMILSALKIPYRYETAKTWRSELWPGQGNMTKLEAVAKCRELCHHFEITGATNDDSRSAVAQMFYLNVRYKRFELEDKVAKGEKAWG